VARLTLGEQRRKGGHVAKKLGDALFGYPVA
jgi:hypothetical protein